MNCQVTSKNEKERHLPNYSIPGPSESDDFGSNYLSVGHIGYSSIKCTSI